MPIGIGIAPIDGAEAGSSEEDVHKADGSYRLILVIDARIVGVPMGHDVPDRHAMARCSDRGRPMSCSVASAPMAWMTHIESGIITGDRSRGESLNLPALGRWLRDAAIILAGI